MNNQVSILADVLANSMEDLDIFDFDQHLVDNNVSVKNAAHIWAEYWKLDPLERDHPSFNWEVWIEEKDFIALQGKSAQQRQYEQVTMKLTDAVSQIEHYLELMPTKGNTKSECQKTNLKQLLQEFESGVNSIEYDDFTPNDYSGDFQISYSGDQQKP